MDTDGESQRRRMDNPAGEWWPAWPPDGTRIAFMSNRETGLPNDTDIFVMSADDTDQHRLPRKRGFEWGIDWRPLESSLAPDSRRGARP